MLLHQIQISLKNSQSGQGSILALAKCWLISSKSKLQFPSLANSSKLERFSFISRTWGIVAEVLQFLFQKQWRYFSYFFPENRFWHYMQIVSYIFSRKQVLTLHANCLHRRQFACNVKTCFLGKIKLWRQFACNVKTCFLGKIKKIF